MLIRSVFLCLLAFTVTVAHAEPAYSIGYVLTLHAFDTYTIHASGTFREILPTLRATIRREFLVANELTHPPHGRPSVFDKPVSLSFDGVTLDDILFSLCKQLGAVYYANGQNGDYPGAYVQLVPRDPLVDARPCATIDGFTIVVEEVSRVENALTAFEWGMPAPATTGGTELDLSLSIRPHTRGALLALLGLDAHATAFPDHGPAIIGKGRGAFRQEPLPPFHDEALGMPASIILPLGRQHPSVLRRVEARLALTSLVSMVQLHIPPDAVGKTFTQDDISVTVEAAHATPTELRLEIAPRRPQAPPGTRYPSTWGGFDLADVIYKDGRSAVTWIVDNNFDSGHQVLTYVLPRQIKAPPAKGFTPIVESAEPTELLLTYIRTGPSDRTVPFVLENIPLP